MPSLFDTVARIAFGFAALVLIVLAILTMAYGVGAAAGALLRWDDVGGAVLNAVGYVVISIAVFEVAKYIIEEELVREREMRIASEARRSLTKFISTIAIAVFLEGLVIVFRVSHEQLSDLVYPSLLLVTGVVMVLGLGLFQRLSADVERRVDSDDRRNERMEEKRQADPEASSPGRT
jgi:hypothetical protein